MVEAHAADTTETFEWHGFRLSWGAIIAGVIVAIVSQIMLSLLALAIGLGAVEFTGPGSPFAEIGIGAGIWAVASALISLFLGGLAAGHLAGVIERFDGFLHGVLVWGVATVITVFAVSSGISTLVGGVFGVAGQTVSTAVMSAGQTGFGPLERSGSAMSASQQQSEQDIVAVLSENTTLTRPQAEEAASAITNSRQQPQTDQFQLQAERLSEQAPETATEVASSVSTAAWWMLLAAILSLAAAIGGAMITAEE